MLKNFKQILLAEQSRWFLWTPVLFALGIGLYFHLSFEPSKWLVVFVIEAFIVLLYLFRKKPSVFFVLSSLLVVALGFANINLQTQYKQKQIELIQKGETTYISGRIFKIDSSAKGKTRLWLKDVSDFENKRKGIYKLTLSSNKNLEIGNCVETAAMFKPFQPQGYYQFERDAFYDGVSAVGFAVSDVFPKDCETKISLKERFLQSINAYRKNLAQKIVETLNPQQAAIAAAVIAGDKSFIRENQYNIYRTSGLAHFLAISGLHMGFMATICFVVLRFIFSLFPYLSLRFSTKNMAAFFAVLVIFFYLLISGMSVSAQRAFIMTSLVFVGFFVLRQAISMRTVATAALIILIFEPYVLVRPSFQMSFAAVTALVAFYEVYTNHQNKIKPRTVLSLILGYFLGIVLTTIIATLATLPFAVYHFSNMALYTLLTNILAAPIIGFIIMPCVFLYLMTAPFHLGYLPLKIIGFGISLLNQICLRISELPYANFSPFHFSFFALMLIVLGGLWLILWKQKWRYFGMLPILIGLFSACFNVKPDVFFDAKGEQIGIKDEQGNLVVLAKKENTFLSHKWLESYGFKKSVNGVHSLSDLICDESKCLYKNQFEFDLNGLLKLNHQDLEGLENLGGEIRFYHNGAIVKTVRDRVGYRPWNSF